MLPGLHIQVHKNILYALSEVDQGSINSYDLSESFVDRKPPKLVASQPVSGSPAHLSLSPQRGVIGLASYSGGLVTFFKYNPQTGSIQDLILKKVFEGKGPNVNRQESPHPHEIVFSLTDSMIYVPDLGTDEIHRLDADDFFNEISPIKVRPGYGPAI